MSGLQKFGRLENWQRFRLPLLLVLAGCVRVVRIQSRGIQYDDAFSIFLSSRQLSEIVRGTAADTMPPLYYFILHFWLQISQDIWVIRLLSVIFSILAVYLTYLLVKEMLHPTAGMWAAFLMAISPFQYYHAQDVRNYALLLCAQLGYLLFFARIYQRERGGKSIRRMDWLGLILCGTAAMYTHNVAVFTLVIPNFFLITNWRWRLFGRLVLAQACIAVLALPWLALVPGQMAKVQRAWWQNPPGIIEILQIPIVWTAGLPLEGIWLIVGVVIGLEILALILFEVLRNGRNIPGVAFLGTVILGLPTLLFVTSYIYKPIFVPRGFILASAGYFGLAGWVISQTWVRGPGKLLLGGFLLAAVIGLPAQINFQGFPRSPFEQAAGELAEIVQPGDRVVHDNKLSYFPFHYYQPRLEQVFIADEPGSGNDTYARASQVAMKLFPEESIDSAVGASERVFFVVFSRTIQEYHDLGEPDHPTLIWLRGNYDQVDRRSYNDLEVIQFVRR